MNYCGERADGFYFNDLEKLVLVRSARPRGGGGLSPSDIEMALTSTFILVQQRDSQGARFLEEKHVHGIEPPTQQQRSFNLHKKNNLHHNFL